MGGSFKLHFNASSGALVLIKKRRVGYLAGAAVGGDLIEVRAVLVHPAHDQVGPDVTLGKN